MGAYSIPDDSTGLPDPRDFYDTLVQTCEEHAHLLNGEPTVAFLYRHDEEISHGRRVLGTCSMPTVMGRMGKVFAWLLEDKLESVPDFLFILDLDWWTAATDLEREILIFHEMMHAGQAVDRYGSPRFHRESGLPVWCIRGHDVEEFTATVARYGAWQREIQNFIDAASAHPGGES